MAEMTVDQKASLLLNQPAALANYNARDYEHLPREEIDTIQLIALKRRFTELRDNIPMLKKLADGAGVEKVEHVNDISTILFDHNVYKSYPPSLLENNRWDQINKWLGKLVTLEISEALAKADVSACEGLDDWFEAIDTQVPALRMGHSSGTSGTISFLPHSRLEYEKNAMVRRMVVWGQTGPDFPKPELHIAYPYFRSGYLTHLRGNDYAVSHILQGESYFHAAYPAHMSSDVLYLGAKIRAAQAKGTMDRLKISPSLLAKKAVFDRLQADMPRHLNHFFDTVVHELKGKRIYTWATWNLLHGMARTGLEREMTGVFAEDSYISTGGGAKGLVQPPGWREDILRFTGAKRLQELYGMTEIMSTHMMCEHGHYHLDHRAIPYVLNPDTGEVLPRQGRVTGRAAFFDLGANARWGGFVTGDEITIDWDTHCPCGRPSAFVVGGSISRYSEKQGGDDKITCAASEAAVRDAMDFLNNFEM